MSFEGASEVKQRSILLIDDEPDILLILKLQLEDVGYIVYLAKNATDFHKLIEEQDISLALIDINMPEVSGFELLDYATKVHIPVIMLTSHGSEDIAVNAMKKGALDYLSKPFSTDDLLEKVARVISHVIEMEDRIRLMQERETEYKQSQIELARLREWVANFTENIQSTITKSIEFDEDAYQAGISILSYFSTIVKQKYPNTKIKIKIEQEERTVRMIIETPNGEKELIEKTLEEYGLVVVGQMQPEELLPVKVDEMQLRHKLEMAKMEITHTRELLD